MEDKENKYTLNKDVLEENFNRISYTLNKDYLSNLSEYYVFGFDDYCKLSNINSEEINFKNFMAVEITQLVFNSEENKIDCMKNLLSSFANTFDSLGLFIKRTCKNVYLYLIFRKNGELDKNGTDVLPKIELLEAAIKGNFNGTETKIINAEVEIKDTFGYLSNVKNISLLTSVPSDKSEKFISQGIEKLLNAVVPVKDSDEDYSVLVLAESITNDGIQNILNGYEELATNLVPYLTHSFQVGESSTETDGEMSSAATTEGISNAITRTHSINFGVNAGSSLTNAGGHSFTESLTETINYSPKGVGGSTALGFAMSQFSSIAKALSMGVSGGYGYSRGKTDTISSGITDTEGTNHSISLGKTENTTYNYKSYYIQSLLDKLELTIKRLNQSKAVGLWKTSTYVFSDNSTIAPNVANFIRGISQGEESFVENSIVHTWNINKEKESVIQLQKYLSNFIHPVFCNAVDLIYHNKELKNSLKQTLSEDKQRNGNSFDDAIDKMYDKMHKQNLIPITATLNISTTELAKIFSLPSHSLPGLPILECAEFGRNVATVDTESDNVNEIKLGKIYHMHHSEENDFKLYTDKLTSHTFITGSTGSGKSNTVYKLIETLVPETSESDENTVNKHFLVIEPAKGEYKKVFGGREDVSVYSTNADISPLLRLNPFSFPNKIHVLEHLDRLVSIFNVCWPMYAAMPAVLKNALEKAYEDAGWNLETSRNEYKKTVYPTFNDVVRNIRLIIDSSEYDAENKGAYKGSLITRLQSLTSGLNKQIFTLEGSLSDAELFEENVIVDLSRLGSNETKSLIMGFLILKLQEYYLSKDNMNAELKHITVLEEAHNLLKRTSTEASSENGNLLGKSVEMIANAIAEMRTYGEAFVIADQSPGLMDMSVIRNTNTKIIMRLPDFSDRELVGKAANLNGKQIEELARLPLGVAAVYQNDWIQPVLCKIDKCKSKEKNYINPSTDGEKQKNDNRSMKYDIVLKLQSNETVDEKNKAEVLEKIDSLNISGCVVVAAKRYIEQKIKKPSFDKLSFIISSLFPEFESELRKLAFNNPTDPDIWKRDLEVLISNQVNEILSQETQTERDVLIITVHRCILQNYIFNEIRKPEIWQKWVS